MKLKFIYWCEKTYLTIHNLKRNTPSWIISFAVAAFSTLPFESTSNVEVVINKLFFDPTLIILLMWGSCLFYVIVLLMDQLIIRFLQKHNDFSELKEIMIQQADANCFDLDKYTNGYIWGQDRTLWVADNLIEGYKTSQIVIEKAFIDKYYQFSGNDSFLNERYNEYLSTSEKIKTSIKKGNNNDRWMVTGFEKNFNKQDKRIYLSLAKTQWSMNQFVWTKVFPEKQLKKKAALESLANDTSKRYYPNSFCLHLVVVSADKKVLINQISGNKDNDYPFTIAATIGEQLELSDFNNSTDYNDQFINKWIKRTFYEEFGIPETTFGRIVDLDSARILSIIEEGDIYNLSIVTTITLNYTYKDFINFISTTIAVDIEFTNPSSIDLEKIPYELSRHFKHCQSKAIKTSHTFTNGQYHPSTPMRLFLTYAHFYGVCRFKNEYLKAWSM